MEADQLDTHMIDYFKSILSIVDLDKPMDFLELLGERITLDMSDKLSWVFRREEVFLDVQQMHPTKALRLDGVLPCFTKSIGI